MSLSLLTTFIYTLVRMFLMTEAIGGGRFELLQENIGINAMHMQLLNNDRVIIFDRTDFGLSNLSLPNGVCRNNPNEPRLKVDCTAHSIEFNAIANTFRPLFVQTNLWCSSGGVTRDGRLIQTGGFNDGDRVIRIMSSCSGGVCDWKEVRNQLAVKRWYATNHILPDGRQIIVGGRRQFNYEFYPKNGVALNTTWRLPFLVQTNDAQIENNLYPFVHLNVDGNLFLFANNRAILLDYVKNRVVKIYPEIPGGEPRCYPSTGSSVLLPLKLESGSNIQAEVLICGGAPKGSFVSASNKIFVRALSTCGRIKITDQNPQWAMETMPVARVMGDMTILPNGNVLIVNGAASGTAGWEFGRDPVLNPVIYFPSNNPESRFEVQNPSTIPRMYHSTALLLRDGRVLIGGSNPNVGYAFSNVLFPTDLRLEAFNPSYLDKEFDISRPRIVSPASKSRITYTMKLTLRFVVTGNLTSNSVKVNMIAPSFTTHSFSMNQRFLTLAIDRGVSGLGNSVYEIRVRTPYSSNLAPGGYYMLFVVHQEIPSTGIWVQLL